MGASAEVVMTDKLGRRSGPRRQYSIAEKRSMVEETHVAALPSRKSPFGTASTPTCSLCGGDCIKKAV